MAALKNVLQIVAVAFVVAGMGVAAFGCMLILEAVIHACEVTPCLR